MRIFAKLYKCVSREMLHMYRRGVASSSQVQWHDVDVQAFPARHQVLASLIALNVTSINHNKLHWPSNGHSQAII